jgi:hypothetical protein
MQVKSGYYNVATMDRLKEQLLKDNLRHTRGIFTPVDYNTTVHNDATRAHMYVMDKIKSLTIRGKSLLGIMERLFEQQGLIYSVAITGGAVRDAILEAPLADVDLVIAAPYSALEMLLKDIFGFKGEVLSESTFRNSGPSKRFGQLKVMRKEGDTLEDLDIAMFKSDRIDHESLIGEEIDRDNLYMYGWSYKEDTQHRDYTMNALYLEMFGNPPYLIDPTGTGYEDAKNGIIKLINPRAFEDYDLGGQFRYIKMINKDLKPHEDQQWIPRVASKCIMNKINFIQGEYEKNFLNAVAEGKLFFNKLRSKLFKDAYSIPRVFENLHTQLIDHVDLKHWWNRLLIFVNSGIGRAIMYEIEAEPIITTELRALLSCFQEKASTYEPFAVEEIIVDDNPAPPQEYNEFTAIVLE